VKRNLFSKKKKLITIHKMNPMNQNLYLSKHNIFLISFADKQQLLNQPMMNYNIPTQKNLNPANPQILHQHQMQSNMNQNFNPAMNMPLQELPKKERLRLKMTQEEK